MFNHDFDRTPFEEPEIILENPLISLVQSEPTSHKMSGVLKQELTIFKGGDEQIGNCIIQYRYPIESAPNWKEKDVRELLKLVKCARVNNIGIINTDEQRYQGKGIGKAIYLHLINSVFKSIPLISSEDLSSFERDGKVGARELWESLVRDGIALKFVKQGVSGYISIPPEMKSQVNFQKYLEQIFYEEFEPRVND